MKISKLGIFILAIGLLLGGCGPVVISSRPNHPPPPWFYPNRVELVRYVYFPEYSIYYDFYDRTYIYWDTGVWLRASVLPLRYRNINLSRARYKRINNFRGDNIQRYHNENPFRGRSNIGRRSTRGN
ncbi:hypothetical protein SB49_08085 [Sediminicola sp. YIK13]|uniref:hypothetical protein n=1 Tax=Sediminicola sp. YIK13 TaxID=1453352 RepID=UPI00071EA4DB|nr:hypothetical protein [Sediminicola sp. YIK13]ALM07764.1 hypothetical protein SB49_08085 [Sediminicola sp. YIK13]